MDLKKFIELINNDLGCLQVVRYLKFENHQFQCRQCQGENEKEQNDPSRTQCADCNYSELLTANTVFARHRKPLPVIMLIILSVVVGGGTPGLEVSRILKVCQNTVWHWQRKARSFFCSFFSPDNTQSVHFSEIAEALHRRTTESEPKPTSDSVLPGAWSALTEPAFVETVQSLDGEECVPTEHTNDVAKATLDQAPANEIIPQPEAARASKAAIKYLVGTYRGGVGHRHAEGYTAQFNFITHFSGRVLEFLTACMRSGPAPARAGPQYLTLPIMPKS